MDGGGKLYGGSKGRHICYVIAWSGIGSVGGARCPVHSQKLRIVYQATTSLVQMMFCFFSSYQTTNKQSPIRDHFWSTWPRPATPRPYMQPATCQSCPCDRHYIAIVLVFNAQSIAYTPPTVYLYTSIMQHQYTSAKHSRHHRDDGCLLLVTTTIVPTVLDDSVDLIDITSMTGNNKRNSAPYRT
jgi:hypothetical protein